MIGNRGRLGSTSRVVRRTVPAAWARCSRWRSPRRRPRRRSRRRTPNIEPFADCPVAVKHVAHCLVATTTSGEFQLANKTVPITKPIVAAGRHHRRLPRARSGGGREHALAHPPDRPGRPHRDRRAAPGRGSDRRHRTRGAGRSVRGKPLRRTGARREAPVKVKLENPILGEECYVGSDTEPIVLQLTTGTTKPPSGTAPITGNPGTREPQPGADDHHDQRRLPGRQHLRGTGGERVRRSTAEPAAGHGRRPPGRPARGRGSQHGGADRTSLQETDTKDVKKAKVVPRG